MGVATAAAPLLGRLLEPAVDLSTVWEPMQWGPVAEVSAPVVARSFQAMLNMYLPQELLIKELMRRDYFLSKVPRRAFDPVDLNLK